jgi:proteasome lid subunit RPN8/RPN11
MRNKKIKTQQQKEVQIKASLKQEKQKPDLTVKRKLKFRKQLTLRFSPTAWAKLLYFRDKSDCEVGGFGITKPDDLLSVIEFVTVKQEVTAVSVKFDDEAVGGFFDEQVDLGRKPEQFGRIWLHSHPGDSPSPSMTDEDTFKRVFGSCQWAIMFIVAQNNKSYAKLSFNVGPGGQVLIPVEIDYSQEFGPSNQEMWDAEYKANVRKITWLSSLDSNSNKDESLVTDDFSNYALPYDFIDEFEQMDPTERQFILDELADRPELWDEESEVMCL